MRGRPSYEYLALLVGSMMLFLVGLADDLIGVGYKKKFMVQILAASLLVASGVWIKSLDGLFGVYQVSPWFGMPFTVLIVVYVTNAINLIDGIDGLASGLCAISLVALAGLHIWLGLYSYALLCISALGVIIPFWYYNVFGNAMRGRKLFMGDSGSLSLGYIISFLMIHLSTVDVHPRAVSDYNINQRSADKLVDQHIVDCKSQLLGARLPRFNTQTLGIHERSVHVKNYSLDHIGPLTGLHY